MSDKSRIVKVKNKEFVADADAALQFYSEDKESLCVIYKGQIFKLDSSYDLQNATKSQSIRLKFKFYSTKIIIPENSDYSAYVIDEDELITSGQSFVIEPYMKTCSVVISESDEENLHEGIEIQVSVKPAELASDEDGKDDVLYGMYEEKDTSIDIIESESTIHDDSEYSYFSDLRNLRNLESVSYLDWAGGGGYRDVYEVMDKTEISHIIRCDQNVVIKIADGQKGIIANKREFQTWCAVKGTSLEKYFCKILNRGPEFRYIIMEKADKILSDEYRNDRSEIKYRMRDRIRNLIKEESIEPPDDHGFDLSYSNLGRTSEDDSYKLIDYPFGGSFEYFE